MTKVLIIDDRRENIIFIANNILQPMGYEIITARDGQTGLKKAEQEVPDLIITDLKLPKLHGLEILEQLLQKGIYIPAIVMTFHGTEETAVKALRLGAKDYLIKPFTFEEMQAALERAFRPMPTSPHAYMRKLEDQAKITTLEEELAKARAQLAEQNQTMSELKKQSANFIDKVELAELAQRAAMWEEDNARINKMLAHAKFALNKTESRANALEDMVITQKNQIEKYKKEVKRLALELRNVSEAMRLMSQDMEQQMNRLTVLIPEEKLGQAEK